MARRPVWNGASRMQGGGSSVARNPIRRLMAAGSAYDEWVSTSDPQA